MVDDAQWLDYVWAGTRHRPPAYWPDQVEFGDDRPPGTRRS
jgi:hypothetical protein